MGHWNHQIFTLKDYSGCAVGNRCWKGDIDVGRGVGVGSLLDHNCWSPNDCYLEHGGEMVAEWPGPLALVSSMSLPPLCSFSQDPHVVVVCKLFPLHSLILPPNFPIYMNVPNSLSSL